MTKDIVQYSKMARRPPKETTKFITEITLEVNKLIDGFKSCGCGIANWKSLFNCLVIDTGGMVNSKF